LYNSVDRLEGFPSCVVFVRSRLGEVEYRRHTAVGAFEDRGPLVPSPALEHSAKSLVNSGPARLVEMIAGEYRLASEF
jgi:hypothetical protein